MTLRILIFAIVLTAIHAQEPPKMCGPIPCASRDDGIFQDNALGSGANAVKVPRVEAPAIDPVLAYQTARANALEAENAALKLQVKSLELQVVQSQAMVSKLTADWPNAKQLEAAQAAAQKALDAARDALKKACPDKWDEVKSTCGK